MPVTYTNRKAVTYYLCQGQTASGKPRYYFTPRNEGDLVEQIPAGYTICENVND